MVSCFEHCDEHLISIKAGNILTGCATSPIQFFQAKPSLLEKLKLKFTVLCAVFSNSVCLGSVVAFI
jgi:hypothetical protein